MKPFVSIALVLAACAASAQQVYRCGNSYSQTPCPGGQAVAATDPGSGDAARAKAAAKVDADRAAAYEKARLEREKAAPKAIVMAEPAAAKASEPKKVQKTDRKKPEHFTAVGPKPAKK